MPDQPRAVLFDLDGVLTDTAELHYQSWQRLADEIGIPWSRARNEALRGLGRAESLAILLGSHAAGVTPEQRAALADRKNAYYLALVEKIDPSDAAPGATRILHELKQVGFQLAVASSSRNARRVLERIGLANHFDAVIDGNQAPRSKPDPQVFLLAAETVRCSPSRCVVVEDAASGVAAARAAGMRVIGVGAEDRVAGADLRIRSVDELTVAIVMSLTG